jgi:hypothetical protein
MKNNSQLKGSSQDDGKLNKKSDRNRCLKFKQITGKELFLLKKWLNETI